MPTNARHWQRQLVSGRAPGIAAWASLAQPLPDNCVLLHVALGANICSVEGLTAQRREGQLPWLSVALPEAGTGFWESHTSALQG